MLDYLRTQSKSAAGAITYVTVGTLLMIWSGLYYYFFLMREPNPSPEQSFTCLGIILSGFAIAAIGLLFGLIGRGAKAADHMVAAGTVTPVAAADQGTGTSAAIGAAPVAAVAPVAAIPTNGVPVGAVPNSRMR